VRVKERLRQGSVKRSRAAIARRDAVFFLRVAPPLREPLRRVSNAGAGTTTSFQEDVPRAIEDIS
jgi:hypothetical protein